MHAAEREFSAAARPTSPNSRLRTHIAALAVADLAQRFGTPLYVYDESVIHARIAELRRFDVIRYAQKACSNLAILDLMRRHGVLVDAVSAGEIHRALRAGYQPTGDPPPIVFTADLFDRAALALCLECGVHVNVGSRDMIHQLGQAAPGANLTLRVNPGFGHGHSHKTNTGGPQSKHGIWHEEVEACLLDVDRYGMAVTGLHIHIGSGTDFDHLSQVCDAMAKLAERVGRTVTTLSAGGGLPVPALPGEQRVDLAHYHALWDQTRHQVADALGHPVRLEIEPGRYLVAESGFLIAEIRAIKRVGDNLFYLVDAGFNNLARPILYGARHPMSVAPRSGDPRPREEVSVVVGGPLCESGDIFTQDEGGWVRTCSLPAAQVGDFLIIECTGAYGFTMASNYNSQPLAAEVLLRAGEALLIRARQSHQDLMSGEMIPAVDPGGG